MGGTLSRRFSSMPLWLNHPANVGAFYGLLLSVALIFPYFFTSDTWFVPWLYHSLLLIAACLILGTISRLINIFTKRLPMGTPRHILYPMPFVGLFLLSLEVTELLAVPLIITWSFLLIPGPLYVHITWAPRWRMLCMLEDGLNPFSQVQIVEESEELELSSDTEMQEVIEEMSNGENSDNKSAMNAPNIV